MFGVVKEERHILVKFFGIKLRLNYPIDWTLISNFNEHKVNENYKVTGQTESPLI